MDPRVRRDGHVCAQDGVHVSMYFSDFRTCCPWVSVVRLALTPAEQAEDLGPVSGDVCDALRCML